MSSPEQLFLADFVKTFLLWVLLAGLGLLWFDDHSKQASLDQAQIQLDSQKHDLATLTHQNDALTVERNELKRQLGQPVATPVPKVNWFQRRLDDPAASLDPPAKRPQATPAIY